MPKKTKKVWVARNIDGTILTYSERPSWNNAYGVWESDVDVEMIDVNDIHPGACIEAELTYEAPRRMRLRDSPNASMQHGRWEFSDDTRIWSLTLKDYRRLPDVLYSINDLKFLSEMPLFREAVLNTFYEECP